MVFLVLLAVLLLEVSAGNLFRFDTTSVARGSESAVGDASASGQHGSSAHRGDVRRPGLQQPPSGRRGPHRQLQLPAVLHLHAATPALAALLHVGDGSTGAMDGFASKRAGAAFHGDGRPWMERFTSSCQAVEAISGDTHSRRVEVQHLRRIRQS